VKDHIKNKLFCPLCGGNDAEPVEVSYAFKLLIEELQGLHLMTKFDLKNRYE
jgi:DNA-directed RNA polymerase beta subunit